ncbi:immunoglobulin lambda-like polypeptide 5 [Sminthopsis crassicaudata]|uniref:immunoglobulin lambda-like polypeptide 5 n=1 Tax=Sminthopsis crassicaudata TaxID=9301 RepID=UPI003D693C34
MRQGSGCIHAVWCPGQKKTLFCSAQTHLKNQSCFWTPEVKKNADKEKVIFRKKQDSAGEKWENRLKEVKELENRLKETWGLLCEEAKIGIRERAKRAVLGCRGAGEGVRQITGRFLCGAVSRCWVFGGGTHLTVLGQPKASPMITAFAPSKDELDTQKATLVCLINGFYPSTVNVAWTKDGSPVTQGVMTSPPARQSDNKYSTSSYLSLSADQWRSSNRYTCKVTHEGQVFQKELSSAQCT